MMRFELTAALKRQLAPRRPRQRPGSAAALHDSAEQLEVRALLTAQPVQVGDINPDGADNPGRLTEVNGTLFFIADDGVHGRELWKSDGTTVSMVKDINSGGADSFPRYLTNVNGTLYFMANDGTHGLELWKSDGTTAQMVMDINDGGNHGYPRNLTEVNGTLYFTAVDGDHGRELWKYDGTTATLVQDIHDGGTGSAPSGLVNVNGALYFAAGDSVNGRELWKTDGTTTELVMDINEGTGSSNPADLTNVNGTLFFTADDGDNGRELWKVDSNGPQLVMDIDPAGSGVGLLAGLTNANGTLYFVADDGVNGYELWKSDGTTAEMVMDINSGSGDSNPWYMTEVNDTLFFSAKDGSNGYRLWKTDGTTTELVPDTQSGLGGFEPYHLTNVNGTLYYTAITAAEGRELWSSDGTTTELVSDIREGGDGADPRYLTNVNGTLFFTADDGTDGRELWKLLVNEAPTEVALENVTSALEENTDTSAPIKVGEIVVTDEGVGTNTLTLSGADAASFEIIGNELFLKAGTTLDFETQDAYAVTIEVTDLDLGSGPHATTDFTLNILDVNEAPTAVTLENVVDTIEENSDTSTRIKVADIVITDDALGTNTLTLSGADATSFEIIGSELFLRAGVTLDFETQTSLDVTVGVTDTDLGSGPHATADFTLNITDVDERPPLVRLVWTIFGWKVQTVRSYVPWLFRRW